MVDDAHETVAVNKYSYLPMLLCLLNHKNKSHRLPSLGSYPMPPARTRIYEELEIGGLRGTRLRERAVNRPGWPKWESLCSPPPPKS
jgi:hypothetical protein